MSSLLKPEVREAVIRVKWSFPSKSSKTFRVHKVEAPPTPVLLSHPWDTIRVTVIPDKWPNFKLNRIWFGVRREGDDRGVFFKSFNFYDLDLGRIPSGMHYFTHSDRYDLANFADLAPFERPEQQRRCLSSARETFTVAFDEELGCNVLRFSFPWPLSLRKTPEDLPPQLWHPLRVHVWMSLGKFPPVEFTACIWGMLVGEFTQNVDFLDLEGTIRAIIPHRAQAFRFALIKGGDLDNNCLAQAVDNGIAIPDGWEIATSEYRTILQLTKPQSPGWYTLFLRAIDWDIQTREITAQTCQAYPFEVPAPSSPNA